MEVKIVLFNQAQVTSLVMIFTVCYNMVYVPFYSEKKKKKAERKTYRTTDSVLRYKVFPQGLQRKDQVLVTLSDLMLWWPPVFFTWVNLLGLSILCS